MTNNEIAKRIAERIAAGPEGTYCVNGPTYCRAKEAALAVLNEVQPETWLDAPDGDGWWEGSFGGHHEAVVNVDGGLAFLPGCERGLSTCEIVGKWRRLHLSAPPVSLPDKPTLCDPVINYPWSSDKYVERDGWWADYSSFIDWAQEYWCFKDEADCCSDDVSFVGVYDLCVRAFMAGREACTD